MSRFAPGVVLVLASVSAQAQEAGDHATMDPSRMDHSTMGHAMPPSDLPPPVAKGTVPATNLPRTPIPQVTDADRAAARLPAGGHAAHGNGVHSLVSVDRLEAWHGKDAEGAAWELQGWIGGDLHTLRFRSEGEFAGGALDHAELDLLYARALSPWWDLQVGLHHESQPESRDAFAFGVSGLAPYKIQTQAMLYLGEGGRASVRVEASYDTLFTNRWILQSRIEARAESREDLDRGVGAGLSRVELGLRLRYEVHRQFAPYLGLVREQALGGTADIQRAHGERVGDWRWVIGIRSWF